MRFFYYFAPLFFVSALFALYLFPAVLEIKQPFLKLKELFVSSYLEKSKQGDLQAREWVGVDSSFGVVEAKGVQFHIYQSGNSWQGYVGHLCQDSLKACIYLLEGVSIEKLKPRISLAGSAFVWEENSLTFHSLGTNWVVFNWQGNMLRSRQFLWNQETGELNMAGDVEGIMNVCQ